MANTPNKDYYEILGVKRSASAHDIRKVLRNLALAACFSCLLLGAAFSQDADVAGRVYDPQGGPLAGVSVTGVYHFSGGGSEKRTSLTDHEGHFQLKSVGSVVFFVAPKYESLTRIRGPQESFVEVSLKPDIEKPQPDPCPAKEPGKRYGDWFLFLVPRGTKTVHHYGDDTWDIDIYFPGSKTKEHVNLWSGAMMGGEHFVLESLVLDASSFSQHGFDWKGRSGDGRNWRWASFFKNLIRYEDASDEAARFFDRVIDSVCVRPLPSVGTTESGKH